MVNYFHPEIFTYFEYAITLPKKYMCSLWYHSTLYGSKPSFTAGRALVQSSAHKLNFADVCPCFGVQVR